METKLQEFETALGDEGDLGEQIIVKRKPKPWTLTLGSDAGGVWSSNVFLESSDPRNDFALTHNDSGNFNYKILDDLSISCFFRFSMYRYYRLISQNFDAYNAGASINYTLPWEIYLSTGVQWTTIYSKPINDSVYEEADANASLIKVVPLAFTPWIKDKAAVFVGYQQDYRKASPADFDKIEYSAFTGLSFAPHPTVLAQVLYRWQYQEYQRYQQSDRHDFNNTVSNSLSWSPLEWITLSGICSWTHNDSVESPRDYKAFNAGANIRLSWKF
jgi:hypothetical protein